MTEEEFFISKYPDSCYGGKPLSPHWDYFEAGVEFGERQSEEKIKKLEKENAELKTKKIPQLERRIASIRGAHSVDAKKLNARIEQVERLKKENAELNDNFKIAKDNEYEYQSLLTKAKELLKWWVNHCGDHDLFYAEKTERFLNSEVEK